MKASKFQKVGEYSRNRRGMPKGTVAAQGKRPGSSRRVAYAYGEIDDRGFLMGWAGSRAMAIACAVGDIVQVRIEVVE